MEDIGHTIYSGFLDLLCMVDTIYCVARKEGEEGEKGRKARALDMFNT